ncbi:zona pellucida sperm-binding protein 4-like [Thalassophryne amazonica]|uniref:zona pellucida sperm-binding protein 4-like n=1 Tax=Thalassophryne amazonica TaxID=390379 RepID=UPI001470DD8E|nr:zona pellucida sperm-binding protein 4-like [Thalassophryne amazonica]
MSFFKYLFGVVIVALSSLLTTQRQWSSAQQYSLLHQQQPKIPPTPPPSDKCHQVEEAQKVECGTSGVTPDQCEALSCCYDGRRCYYGKAITVQCTKDGQFIVVVSQEATRPPLDVDSIGLLDTSGAACQPAGINSGFVIFQFPVTECGSTVKEEDYIVYENYIVSSYLVGLGPRGSITRDSTFELLFQCRYSSKDIEALIIDVNTLPPPQSVAVDGPLRVELRLAKGECHVKGCVEEVAAYSSFYTDTDYPITKMLREPVYVDVRLLERSDPNIVLLLEHCWATSNPEPESLPQWDLLFNGCPYKDSDLYLTEVLPVDDSEIPYPSHHKHFVMKMFTFVDQDLIPQRTMVYIHCTTTLCHQSSIDSCEQTCYRQRRATSAVRKVSSGQKLQVSSGKVILTDQRAVHKEN